MSDTIKKKARKQFFRYFRVWFIVVGILLALAVITYITHVIKNNVPRANHSAPTQRVYDQANVLTDKEEDSLRQRIAEVESRHHIDVVLVTFSQSVEGEDAMRQYGYRSTDWEQNMQDYADDFWDENQYGYNKGFEGDGCILVHNWYEGQNGEHLSTSGKVEAAFSSYDIDTVLYAVDRYYDTDPYKAYLAYIDEVDSLLSQKEHPIGTGTFSWTAVLLIPSVAAAIYALVNLRQKKAEDTTSSSTYVEGRKPVMKAQSDEFMHKNVVTRRIESASSGGGGGGHSGGGGHHTSSHGASHGGGSHRH